MEKIDHLENISGAYESIESWDSADEDNNHMKLYPQISLDISPRLKNENRSKLKAHTKQFSVVKQK